MPTSTGRAVRMRPLAGISHSPRSRQKSQAPAAGGPVFRAGAAPPPGVKPAPKPPAPKPRPAARPQPAKPSSKIVKW
jgi:hypothetical protein